MLFLLCSRQLSSSFCTDIMYLRVDWEGLQKTLINTRWDGIMIIDLSWFGLGLELELELDLDLDLDLDCLEEKGGRLSWNNSLQGHACWTYFAQGVIVYSMSDLPIGFGVAAKATAECRHADPMNVIAFHQVKYIRNNILPPVRVNSTFVMFHQIILIRHQTLDSLPKVKLEPYSELVGYYL